MSDIQSGDVWSVIRAKINMAIKWASAPVGEVVESGLYSARHYANASGTSATASAASASAAAGSASTANTKAGEASASATASAASAANAANSAAAAQANAALSLKKADNLSDLASTDTALNNLGFSALGKTLRAIADAAAGRAALGMTAVGSAIATAADAAAQRLALGLGTAAVANTGTAAGNVPTLDGSGLLAAARIPVLEARSLNGAGNAPVFGIRAWCNFNGTTATGTYSQSGNVITVTITGHGLATGEIVPLTFTTGTGVSGSYVVTVTGANTFTVTAPDSKTTSGNVSRGVYLRRSGNFASVSRSGVGVNPLTFITAAPDTGYSVLATARWNQANGALGNAGFGSNTAKSTTGFDLLVMQANNAALFDSAEVNVWVIW